VKVRRAVMMGVQQTDYMQAATGGDASAYQTCRSFFPCGTEYGADFPTDAMQGDIGKARAMLAASGYSGERAVIINPTDLSSVGQMGAVTYDLLRRMGMNVEMAASDWGTVVMRRNSREPVEKGGWSIFHLYAPSNVRFTPVEHSSIRGLGLKGGFPGWYQDDTMEAMTRRFIQTATSTIASSRIIAASRADVDRCSASRASHQLPRLRRTQELPALSFSHVPAPSRLYTALSLHAPDSHRAR
jgi:peptide/nickel transport system substrate-binding protein